MIHEDVITSSNKEESPELELSHPNIPSRKAVALCYSFEFPKTKSLLNYSKD